jgi:hypothetical protein
MKYYIFLILFISYTASAQLDMNINNKAGVSDVIQIYNNQEITFPNSSEDDVMYIKKNDGTTDVIKLSDINKIIFDGVVSVYEEITQLFNLGSYPNPFYESTNIAYLLYKQSKVELNIFDMNGNLIYSLVNEIQDAGNYSIKWEGTNNEERRVSSGNYIYQLSVDNSIVTKQIIFIK